MDLYDIIAGDTDFDRWDTVEVIDTWEDDEVPDDEEVSLDEYLETADL